MRLAGIKATVWDGTSVLTLMIGHPERVPRELGRHARAWDS